MGMVFDPAIYRQAVLLTEDVNSIPKCSNEYAPLGACQRSWDGGSEEMSGKIELKWSAMWGFHKIGLPQAIIHF